MNSTPKALRLQIGLFGRMNVGKSSFLNMILNQDLAITSPVAGTTTDVVEKAMELLPVGPVVFLDTAGLDDTSALAGQRLKKTAKVFERADIIVLIVEPNIWQEYEQSVMAQVKAKNTPCLIVINKIDQNIPDPVFTEMIKDQAKNAYIKCSSVDSVNSNKYINDFKKEILKIIPEDFLRAPALIGDLLKPGQIAVLIVPIDLQAPKGRLILPQVQTIRDALDNDAAVMVVKEREYAHFLAGLKNTPGIVVCDSQVSLKMVADTPPHIKCTTFSILFARYKGNLPEFVRGSLMIDKLQAKDKILIAESCSHHAIEDDIGRVKIPRWIRQYIGCDLNIDFCSGRDFPEDLTKYKLIISCGGCMLTRREMLYRISLAKEQNVAITNYGVCIAKVQGILKRVLSPFNAAGEILESEKFLINK